MKAPRGGRIAARFRRSETDPSFGRRRMTVTRPASCFAGESREAGSLEAAPTRRTSSATDRSPIEIRLRPSATPVKDKHELQALAASALAACGYRLLECVVGSDRRVRLVIDAEPEVDLKDCVRAHKAVIEGLRAAGEDPEEFTIEVQSPGENRLIAGQRDYERFRGEGVLVRVGGAASGGAGRRTLYGVLLGCENGVLRLAERDSKSEMSFPLGDVNEVRLHRKS